MLTNKLLIEAIYRAQAAGVPEDGRALTLMSAAGVEDITLREAREHLAVLLCKEPRR